MKPIEKYQQKFIELLKEAEEELGGNLCVKVSSKNNTVESNLTYPQFVREYNCSIATANGFLL